MRQLWFGTGRQNAGDLVSPGQKRRADLERAAEAGAYVALPGRPPRAEVRRCRNHAVAKLWRRGSALLRCMERSISADGHAAGACRRVR